MLDFMERMEISAEIQLEEMTQDLPKGKFKCSCGNIEDLDHAIPATNSPYAMPMCRKCLEKKNNGKH